MGKLELIIYHGTTGWDVSQMVEKIVWGGRKGSAARYIEVSMLDDDSKGRTRVNIDVEEGYTCLFKWDKEELFRGIIMKQTSTHKKTVKWKAYDEGIYLANSKDSFSYTNKTATDIFRDCIKRSGLTMGNAVKTGYVIPSLQKSKAYFWDCLLDALATTYSKTKNRYYIKAEKNKISLLKRSEQTTQWVVEFGGNLTNYSYSKSIEKTYTTFRIYSDEGKVVYEKTNVALEKKIGKFILVDNIDDKQNDAQMKKLVNTMMEEYGYPVQSLSIGAIGISSVTSGGCLYVVIPHLNIKRTFYVDEDKHTFQGEKHTMSLKLNFASDIATAG